MAGIVTSIEELETLYATPGSASFEKVAQRLTPAYRDWIAASKFCILSTVGPEGTDASPRGDDGAVVTEIDPGTLALPDWRGNNRLDSLRNIVMDGRASLMFMVPGNNNVVRINGTAVLTTDPEMIKRFARGTAMPRSVILFTIGEIYFQCARALMRSGLWNADPANGAGLATPGEILAEMTNGRAGGEDYDQAWPIRARDTMW